MNSTNTISTLKEKPLKTKNISCVINSDGVCIQSSDPSLIGRMISVPVEKVKKIDQTSPPESTDLFFASLLTSYNPNNLEKYESELKALGYEPEAKRSAVIVSLKSFAEELDSQSNFERDAVIKKWKSRIRDAFNGFFSKNKDIIVSYIGDDKFLILKAVDDVGFERFKKLMKNSHKGIFSTVHSLKIKEIDAAFGNCYQGVSGWIDSYREASLALEIGEKLWGGNQSFYFGDLGMFYVLADGDRMKKTQFAKQALRSLEDHEELLETLEVFFKNNLNLTDTADNLKIHRNTAVYRINQIAQILGLDPRIFDHAVTMQIALLLKKLA